MTRIILIGGAPTSGKTTITQQLANNLRLPWISTDQIRSVIKSLADESRYSDLFLNANEDKSVDEIVNLEIRRAEIVWNGVLALVKHYHPWDGCIIEGTAVLPYLVARDLDNDAKIKAAFLVHTNLKRIDEIVLERSKLPYINTKTPLQQEKKIKQIQLLNQIIKTDAEKYGFPIIEACTSQTFDKIKEALV